MVNGEVNVKFDPYNETSRCFLFSVLKDDTNPTNLCGTKVKSNLGVGLSSVVYLVNTTLMRPHKDGTAVNATLVIRVGVALVQQNGIGNEICCPYGQSNGT